MTDREKVIKGLEILMNGCEDIDCADCCFYISTKPTRCGLREEQIQEDALALLKEQQNQIWEMQDRTEYLEDKLKEQPQIVRCKDCKKRYTVLCIQEEVGNINNQDDWFCANGEMKE